MRPNKIFQVALVLVLMFSSTLITYPVCAESAPSVPQFTLQYVNSSYTIPPTYGINAYNGQTYMVSPGRYVDNQSIEVSILNQPFTPYSDGNHTIQLYYNIRCKGHYEEFTSNTDLGSHGIGGVAASASDDTVVSFNIVDWGIPTGGQVDFQVQAFIGYTYFNGEECFTANVVTVGESAWSDTQTITIGSQSFSNSTSAPEFAPTPTPTPTPIPYANAYNTSHSGATPTPAAILGLQGGLSFRSGFNLQDTALIVMAAVIAVLAGVLAAVINWRKSPSN